MQLEQSKNSPIQHSFHSFSLSVCVFVCVFVLMLYFIIWNIYEYGRMDESRRKHRILL